MPLRDDQDFVRLESRVRKLEQYVDLPADWAVGEAGLADRPRPVTPPVPSAPILQPVPPAPLALDWASRRATDPVRSRPDLLGTSKTLPRLNPLLVAGFAMGGASALPTRTVEAPGGPVEELQLIQRTADDDTILLSNLSYLSLVMSEHYRAAAQHVQRVLTEKDSRDITLDALKWVSKTVFLTGLNAVSAGAAGYLGELLGHTFTQLLDERDKDLGAALGEGVYATGELTLEKIAHKLTAGHHHQAELDATEFFTAQEKALRLVLAKKAAGWSEDPTQVLVERTKAIWEVIGVAGGGAKSLEALLRRKIVSREFEEGLKELERWLPVYMRRLIWRSYCRSQWHRTTFRYAMNTGREPPEDERGRPASEWPESVWTHTRGGEPSHWRQICQDFQGPEHTSATEAGELRQRRWVSMAVVHCCQVHRPSSLGAASDWLIDLEREERHFEGQAVPHAGSIREVLQDRVQLSDYQLLFTDVADVVAAAGAGRQISGADVLRAVHTKGGVLVRIKEIIVGDAGISLMKAAQKRGMGRIDQPGSEGAPAVVMARDQTLIVTVVASDTVKTPIKIAVRPYGATGLPHPSASEEVSFRHGKEQTAQFRIRYGRCGVQVYVEGPPQADAPAVRLKETLILADPTRWFVKVL
jgi:hypothetical protein